MKRKKRLSRATSVSRDQQEADKVEAALAGEEYRCVVDRYRLDERGAVPRSDYYYKLNCGHSFRVGNHAAGVPKMGTRMVCMSCVWYTKQYPTQPKPGTTVTMSTPNRFKP